MPGENTRILGRARRDGLYRSINLQVYAKPDTAKQRAYRLESSCNKSCLLVNHVIDWLCATTPSPTCLRSRTRHNLEKKAFGLEALCRQGTDRA